jgi:hypothetical protein
MDNVEIQLTDDMTTAELEMFCTRRDNGGELLRLTFEACLRGAIADHDVNGIRIWEAELFNHNQLTDDDSSFLTSCGILPDLQ